jgi:Protein of unknown function (DUF3106)
MAKAVLGIAVWLVLALPHPAAYADKNNPAWTELSPEQQRVLAPIQGEWESLDAPRKRKWLGVVQRYPKMTADEQVRLQQRIKEWISLTPEQRWAARGKYREFEQLPPEDRQAVREKWDKFQQEQAAKEAAAKAADTDSAAKSVDAAATEGGAATAAPRQ